MHIQLLDHIFNRVPATSCCLCFEDDRSWQRPSYNYKYCLNCRMPIMQKEMDKWQLLNVSSKTLTKAQIHRWHEFISGREKPFFAKMTSESRILPRVFRESLREDLKYTNEGFDTTKRMVKSRIEGLNMEEKIWNLDTDMDIDGLTVNEKPKFVTEEKDIMWPTSSAGLHQETDVNRGKSSSPAVRLTQGPSASTADEDEEQSVRQAIRLTPAPSVTSDAEEDRE